MRRLLLLSAALLLSQPALAFEQTALMRIFFSVVLVRGYDDTGGLAFGSGVVVAANQVVTNCHVLRKTSQAWISQGEDSYPIISVQADTHHDLCLLNFERLPIKPAETGRTSDLARGDEVIAIGHSSGNYSPITSLGQVKSLYPFGQGKVIRSNARFAMGASGSPLFDTKGRLVGFNTFKTPGRAAYFYAMPIEWLDELKKRPAQSLLPVSGLAFWELGDEEKPYFMQVALPRLHEDWARLIEISQRWTSTEPENPEAWYELGSAQEGLGKLADARISFQKTVAIDPSHGEALLRLGVFASRQGDLDASNEISTALAKISPDLAAELNRAIGCNREC